MLCQASYREPAATSYGLGPTTAPPLRDHNLSAVGPGEDLSGAVSATPAASVLRPACRSRSKATKAMPTTMAALVMALSCSPWVKAPRAALSNPAVRGSGSRSATLTAPPKVSLAASARPDGTPSGKAPAASLRYTAVPMLPKTAIPKAPPNSALVSEIPEAAPAFSGGALPTMMWVARVPTGAMRREKVTDPATSIADPEPAPICATTPRPTAESIRPAAITNAGRTRRATSSASMEPAISPPADGSVHKPASSGERPSTSCRYWAMEKEDTGDHE